MIKTSKGSLIYVIMISISSPPLPTAVCILLARTCEANLSTLVDDRFANLREMAAIY